MTSWVLLLQTSTLPNDPFKLPPDSTKPWEAQIQVYSNKVKSKQPMLVLQFADSPKSYFMILGSALLTKEVGNLGNGGDRVLEADKDMELIIDKVQLYKSQQTITMKGTLNTWGDNSVLCATVSTTAGTKVVLVDGHYCSYASAERK